MHRPRISDRSMGFFTPRQNAVGGAKKVSTNTFIEQVHEDFKTRREGRDESVGVDHSEILVRLKQWKATGEAQESEREKGGKCSPRTLHSRDGLCDGRHYLYQLQTQWCLVEDFRLLLIDSFECCHCVRYLIEVKCLNLIGGHWGVSILKKTGIMPHNSGIMGA